MPPTLTPAGLRIAEAAEELFYARGIAAVGVDLIAQHSGTTKRTLYDQFGSKDRLVATYLARRDERWRALVEKTVAESADPLDAVTAPLRALAVWGAMNTRGCALVNALAELPDPAHPGRRIALEEKTWLLELLERLATEACCAGPRSLAIRLLVLHEGALATQPLTVDTLPEVLSAARQMVDGAASGSSHGPGTATSAPSTVGALQRSGAPAAGARTRSAERLPPSRR